MFWLMLMLNGWAEDDARAAQKAMISHTVVQTALVEGNAKLALKESRLLLDSLECPQRVPLSKELAKVYIDQGYAYHLLSDDEGVQLSWEQAFSTDPEVQFDDVLLVNLSENDQEDLLNRFEQIRGLVEAQGVFDPAIPNASGLKVFIDGRTISEGQGVKPGRHLAQVVCPVEGLQSRWTTFETPLPWDEMCPSGFESGESNAEDDFFTSGFFAAVEDTSQYYNPEPTCESGGLSLGLSELSFDGLSMFDSPAAVSLTSGAGLVLGGAIAYYAWVAPTYAAVEDAQQRASQQAISKADAQAISKSFNVARYTTLGLLAGGTILTGYGTYLSTRQVSIVPMGMGVVGVQTQF